MKEQKQKIVNNKIGDCFVACMATLLELPIEVLPNDHSSAWVRVWDVFLEQFGLSISYHGKDGAIWNVNPWIASVKSKNYKNGSHVIILHNGGEVLFDPSTKKLYKKGESLLGKDVVNGGFVITVSDFSKLHLLEKYRNYIR